jgi:hypothetical protein
VGLLGVEEELLPDRVVELRREEFVTELFKLLRTLLDVAHAEGDVMQALPPLREKVLKEALLAYRLEQFDDASTRKLELRPAKALGSLGAAHQEACAEDVTDQRHKRADLSGGDRNMIEPVGDPSALLLAFDRRRF